MSLEIELLAAAWDNAKKNVFGGDGWNIDPITGEVLSGEMPDDLADLVADIDDKMMDLVGYYNTDDEADDDSQFVDVGNWFASDENSDPSAGL